MSSKKILFFIGTAILMAALMSFNNPSALVSDFNVAANILVKTDTLPSDVQDRIAEMQQKREAIRQEVERIKTEQDQQANNKAIADRAALDKLKKKADKEAKAQEKARTELALAKIEAAKKAEAERIALEKQIKEREKQAKAVAKAQEKARRDAVAAKTKEAKKLKANQSALEKQKKKEEKQAIALAKAREKAQEKARKEAALGNVSDTKAEIAILKKEKKQREKQAKALAKAQEKERKKAALANINNNDNKAQIAILEKEKKQREKEAKALKKQQEREAIARAKAQGKAMGKAPKEAPLANTDDAEKKRIAALEKERKKQAKQAKALAKAQEKARKENALANTDDAEKKRIAALEKERKKQAKALAKAQEKARKENAMANTGDAEKARIAALEKERKKQAKQAKALVKAQEREAIALAKAQEKARQAAQQAGIVDDELPPSSSEATRPTDRMENPRDYVETVSENNKAKEGKRTKVDTPAPAPPKQKVAETNKTKNAVRNALDTERKKKKKRNKKLAKSGREEISLEDCRFSFNEFDPMTQKVKRGLENRFFFSYTQEAIKEYLQGQDYMVCKGGLVDIQGIIALNIEFTIDSPQARYEYGSIGAGTQMIFKLIDGETIILLSEQSDSGRVKRSTGKTEYSSVFMINPKDEKMLRKTEISEVRMVWGTGYEDYQVNELDFLIDQFQCIDAARDN